MKREFLDFVNHSLRDIHLRLGVADATLIITPTEDPELLGGGNCDTIPPGKALRIKCEGKILECMRSGLDFEIRPLWRGTALPGFRYEPFAKDGAENAIIMRFFPQREGSKS